MLWGATDVAIPFLKACFYLYIRVLILPAAFHVLLQVRWTFMALLMKVLCLQHLESPPAPVSLFKFILYIVYLHYNDFSDVVS